MKKIKNLPLLLIITFIALASLLLVYYLPRSQDTRSKGYTEETSVSPQTVLEPTTTTVEKTREPLYLGFIVKTISDQDINDVNQLSNNQVSLIGSYIQWGNTGNSKFTPEFFQVFKRRQITPLITWEPWDPSAGVNQKNYTLRSIINGDHDEYIRQSAQAIKRAEMPVFLRFAHEMNGNWYPWSGTTNGNTAQEYKAAWQHVVELFRSEEVTNVTWVWSPNSASYPNDPLNDLAAYYPGDDYVDWVALDGFNWGTKQASSGWQSFDSIFQESYLKLVNLTSKPIMIAEVASTELGGNKATWIKETLEQSLKDNYAQIRAVVFFNLNKETDWRIESSPTSVTQFIESLNSLPFVTNLNLLNGKILEPSL